MDIPVSKDASGQQPIPTVWRHTVSEIISALVVGDYRLGCVKKNVIISPGIAEQIERNVLGYGAKLVELPTDGWGVSACQWMNGYWEAIVDLYTAEEGRSDLALFLRVAEEGEDGFVFEVDSVHVP